MRGKGGNKRGAVKGQSTCRAQARTGQRKEERAAVEEQDLTWKKKRKPKEHKPVGSTEQKKKRGKRKAKALAHRTTSALARLLHPSLRKLSIHSPMEEEMGTEEEQGVPRSAMHRVTTPVTSLSPPCLVSLYQGTNESKPNRHSRSVCVFCFFCRSATSPCHASSPASRRHENTETRTGEKA